jgi:hypothetical protein
MRIRIRNKAQRTLQVFFSFGFFHLNFVLFLVISQFLYRSLFCLGKPKRIHLRIREPEHTGGDDPLAAPHPRPGNRSEKGASRGQELPPAAASLWHAVGGLTPARRRAGGQCEPGRGGASQDVLSCCRLVPRKSGSERQLAVLRIRDVYPGSRIRLFSIPDPNCLHPGSRIRIKEFKYFNPKNGF